ncbi:nicotinate-nucleotide adenylyltransferase [Chelativorans sp. BNC1]|jgi:nicotinate-nucleotide adenylyltransferase|uniref:Probable nicotinate-nucleotide adenylyltransferase n=1 Tax=Chelativorans sp. (strain BNC1) TaxID=266779 RepID=Q11CP9_CHESB
MLSGGEDVAAHYLRMPFAEKDMTVGLFGGSFNPPHAGHALVAETALRRLKLDQLWWIVSPGNPLKDHSKLAPLGERIALSKAYAKDPRVKVTAFEAAHHIRYTADMIHLVLQRNRGIHFVWIMGADSLRTFHKWERWREIVRSVPIAVIDRPGSTLSFLSSTMAKTFDHARIDETDAPLLARLWPPAWTFIHGPRSSLSSTALRGEAGGKDPESVEPAKP